LTLEDQKTGEKTVYKKGELSQNQSISQSVNQSISQSVNQSISQSVNQSISQSVNQSISQSVNQYHRAIATDPKQDTVLVLTYAVTSATPLSVPAPGEKFH